LYLIIFFSMSFTLLSYNKQVNRQRHEEKLFVIKKETLLKINRLQTHRTRVFHSSGDNSALKSIAKYMML